MTSPILSAVDRLPSAVLLPLVEASGMNVGVGVGVGAGIPLELDPADVVVTPNGVMIISDRPAMFSLAAHSAIVALMSRYLNVAQ